MTTFEILISFISSGIFLALLGMFYRMGINQGKIEEKFHHIDLQIKELKEDIREMREDIREIRKDVSRLDREVGIITATLRFNGFDLDRHKAEGE